MDDLVSLGILKNSTDIDVLTIIRNKPQQELMEGSGLEALLPWPVKLTRFFIIVHHYGHLAKYPLSPSDGPHLHLRLWDSGNSDSFHPSRGEQVI